MDLKVDIWLQWEQIQQQGEIYTPRTGHSIIVLDKMIYLFSGIDDFDKQNDLYEFSFFTQKWKKLKCSGEIPQARSGSTIIGYNNCFIIFGGYTGNKGSYFNDIHKFNPENQSWTTIQLKNPPSPRIDHIMCKYNDIIILFGGCNSQKRLNDMYELHLSQNFYKQVSVQEGNGPHARFGHSGVIHEDRLYIFGGWDGSTTLNDLWEFNIKTQKWILLDEHCALPQRYRHTAIMYKNCMYIFGGVDRTQERFGDLYEYNIQLKLWKRIIICGEGPSSRSFHKCIIYESFMYILGGFDGVRKNDMYRINLDLVQIQSQRDLLKYSNQLLSQKQEKKDKFIQICSIEERWFAVPQKGEIYTPRTGHTGIVVNSKIYIFGGIDQEGVRKNDLYCYDVKESLWSKVQQQGTPPQPRSGTKCVVYENENQETQIIFFGGYINKDIQHCNDINIFNVNTLKWENCAVQNAKDTTDIPLKRTDHSMVRFNKSLYVFGGKAESKLICSDLKRFNLQKRIWKDIQGEGTLIQRRFGHVAVVHEYSMYVFGGWDGQSCLNDMYQYSFPTNIWYEVRRTQGQKPSPRYRHDSLVFQKKMYIMGGVDENQQRFNDLYEFNFERREWTYILTTGCIPSKRTFHKFLNIENALFLVGGYDGERKSDLFLIIVEKDSDEDLFNYSFNRQNSSKSVSMIQSLNNIDNAQSNEQYIIEMLNQQVKELSKKLQKEEERNLCKICFQREIDAILLECCHFVLCFTCTETIKICPICRSVITQVIKSFNL